MTDIQRKTAVIQSIESLQLGQHLIVALDDRETAEMYCHRCAIFTRLN